MIGLGRQADVRQPHGDILGRALECDVNDGRPTRLLVQPADEQFHLRFRDARRNVNAQVRPVESGANDVGFFNVKSASNVGSDGRRRGCRQAQNAADIQFLGELRQLEIIGAKIMAPLADAMRFVHGQQRNLQSPQGLLEALVGQPFRRDVEQAQLALREVVHRLAVFIGGE